MKPRRKRKQKPFKSIYWCIYYEEYIEARKAIRCCQQKKQCRQLKILGFKQAGVRSQNKEIKKLCALCASAVTK